MMKNQRKESEYAPFIRAVKKKVKEMERLVESGGDKAFILFALNGDGIVGGKADSFREVAKGKKKCLAVMLAMAMNDKDFMEILDLATRFRHREQVRLLAMAKKLFKIEPFEA